jgi:hypothetical protein
MKCIKLDFIKGIMDYNLMGLEAKENPIKQIKINPINYINWKLLIIPLLKSISPILSLTLSPILSLSLSLSLSQPTQTTSI